MRITAIVLISLLLSSAVMAETINFKTGESVQAKVLQKDAKTVKVDLNGLTMTYYTDEIKDIDGQPLNAPAPKPTVLAPTTSKEQLAEKRALILKFIDVFGTRAAMIQNFEAVLNNLEIQRPEEAKKIREKFKIDEVIERIVPLYEKYFTTEDLKAYIEFYGSDQGKRLISNITSVTKESVQVTTKYLQEKFVGTDGK